MTLTIVLCRFIKQFSVAPLEIVEQLLQCSSGADGAEPMEQLLSQGT